MLDKGDEERRCLMFPDYYLHSKGDTGSPHSIMGKRCVHSMEDASTARLATAKQYAGYYWCEWPLSDNGWPLFVGQALYMRNNLKDLQRTYKSHGRCGLSTPDIG